MVRGRVPDAGKKRDVSVCVRFTPEEAERLDRERGNRTRSQFVRETVRRAGQ